MSTLRPIPFAALARRVFREPAARGSIFDLPLRRFVHGSADHDLAVDLGGQRAASPLGPAAGPHTQLAQNILLSWLAGGRVLELKTVQQLDHLTIPRPCIDAREGALNCEWSQELTLPESLEEYVKGALLIAMVRQSGLAGVRDDFGDTVFDASVGYDLSGLKAPGVDGFLRGLADVRPVLSRLRAELPAPSCAPSAT
jgi:putative selenate reductase